MPCCVPLPLCGMSIQEASELLTCQGLGVWCHAFVESAYKRTPVDHWNIPIHGTSTFKHPQKMQAVELTKLQEFGIDVNGN